MSPDRNAPCPCGSGKKYKKCHGMAAPVVSLNKADSFSLNRLVAYKGNIGKRREQFCLDYADSKRKMITEVENELSREVAASGNKITCSKGCGECCTAFIAASLQECEAIVYYLYHHEETLRHFLDEYKVWKAGIDKIENLFRRVCAMQESIMSAPYTESQISSFAEESERFMEQRIHCPFLMDGACSIYPVRPYVCAGVVSTSPPEWCNFTHPCHEKIVITKAETNLDCDMPYFIKPARSITYLCMQEFVHEILQHGYTAISSLPGLEGMTHEAASDPEVRMILGQA